MADDQLDDFTKWDDEKLQLHSFVLLEGVKNTEDKDKLNAIRETINRLDTEFKRRGMHPLRLEDIED